MNEDDVLSKYGLVPNETDLPALRSLLKEELRLYSWARNADELIKVICVQLFAGGHVEDSLLIRNAKSMSFDLSCSVDVQLLCGAGLVETKNYLAKLQSKDARDAIQYICSCEKARDFIDFSPTEFIESFKKYYQKS